MDGSGGLGLGLMDINGANSSDSVPSSPTASPSRPSSPGTPQSPPGSVGGVGGGTPHRDKAVPSLAPKVYWGKMSRAVVSERSLHLNQFLAATLNKTRDTNPNPNPSANPGGGSSALPSLVHRFLDPLGQNLTRHSRQAGPTGHRDDTGTGTATGSAVLSLSPHAANNLRRKHRSPNPSRSPNQSHSHSHTHGKDFRSTHKHSVQPDPGVKEGVLPSSTNTNTLLEVVPTTATTTTTTAITPALKGDLESSSSVFGIAYIAIVLSVLLGIIVHTDIPWESLI